MMPKFKAWDKEGKRMIDVTLINFLTDNIGTYVGVDEYDEPQYKYYLFDDVEIMQCSGMNDANHVEICEGDIVKIDDLFNGLMTAKVVIDNGAFGFVGLDRDVIEVVDSNWNDSLLTMAYLSWTYEHPENELLNVVVIGNIHQNPELLEGISE